MNQIVRAFKAWPYRGGRPQRWARIENRLWASVLSHPVTGVPVLGLLGPNGAGKSTTIGMLTTTIKPTITDAALSLCTPGQPTQVTMADVPPLRAWRGGERPLRHAPGTFG